MAYNPTPSQKQAIENYGHNILVSAGAGSGKTGVLKDRVVHKLKQGIHVDQLIILTFTKAAASEMKSRIIEAIQNDESLTNELSRIDQAIITTFDAFCLKLVQEYHYLLDLPKHVTIGDKIQYLTMEKAVLEEVIKDCYLKNDEVFNEMIKLYFQKGDSFLPETIKYLASKLLKEPNYQDVLLRLESSFDLDKLETHFTMFNRILMEDREQAYKLAKDSIRVLSTYDTPGMVKYVAELTAYFNQFLTNDFDLFITNILNKPFPKKARAGNDEDLKEALNHYHPKVKQYIDDLKKIINDLTISSKQQAINRVLSTKTNVDKIIEITETYIKALNQRKKETVLYQYQDIMDLAINLLENHPDIRAYYQSNINEIMIDEYQDTNDLQVYFISLISQNNLFMVGDIKQSIYGFRDANPKNFHDKYVAYQKGINGELITLRENFRSREKVLEDINLVFKHVMDEEIGGINYQDNQSLIYGLKAYDKKQKNQAYGIDLITYDLESLKETDETIDKVTEESELLAKDIRHKMDQSFKILDGSNFRNMKYSDIAIIIDRKTDFKRLTETLSKYNIPVNLYSDEPFIDSSEMIFIISMIKLIYCTIDFEYAKTNFKKLLYSVARSFVYQISDDLIIHYLLDESCHINTLNGVDCFKEINTVLLTLSSKIKDTPVSDILKELFQLTDIYRKISLLDNPRKKEEKLDFFFETIDGFENFSYRDLIIYLDALNENPEWDIEYATQKSDVDAVSLMTMHKSKGLQFPVVYCPFLSKQFNFVENKNLFVYDQDIGLIGNAFDEGFNKTYLRYLSLYKTKKDYISERIRLLYVAFTRAKEHLILFADVLDLKPEYDELTDGYISKQIRMKYRSFTDLLSSTEIKNYIYQNAPTEQVISKNQHPFNVSNRLIEKKQFDFTKTEIVDLRYSKSEQALFSDDVIDMIAYGNQIHLMLEQIDFDHLDQSLSMLPPTIKESFETLLDTEIFEFEKNPKIYQEYEFYTTNDLESRHGIIDLLVIYDDCAYILDYKLKNISDEAYKEQLLGYKKYVSKKLKKPIKTYLYSIIDQILQEIS